MTSQNVAIKDFTNLPETVTPGPLTKSFNQIEYRLKDYKNNESVPYDEVTSIWRMLSESPTAVMASCFGFSSSLYGKFSTIAGFNEVWFVLRPERGSRLLCQSNIGHLYKYVSTVLPQIEQNNCCLLYQGFNWRALCQKQVSRAGTNDYA